MPASALKSASPLNKLPVESIDLHVPSLEELATVLKDGLSKNFAVVDVSVVQCPDLRQHPWTLASSGICGMPRIADVGGPPYLLPTPKLHKFFDRLTVTFINKRHIKDCTAKYSFNYPPKEKGNSGGYIQRHKVFSFDKIAETSELPGGFMIGAGAGSSFFVGVNCEMMANLNTSSGGTDSIFTKTARVCEKDGSCILDNYKCGEFGLLGNFLLSKGETGKVLKVCATRRLDKANFISCMRTTLGRHYGNNVVGMGGVFVIEKGKAKFHIMPHFSKTPLRTDEDVDNWLKFYEMNSPLVCVGVFESFDPGLDLRVEHFHGFSHQGEGGHYHYDVTPEEVQYVGYFIPAERLYRIDKPDVTHKIGRDMEEDNK